MTVVDSGGKAERSMGCSSLTTLGFAAVFFRGEGFGAFAGLAELLEPRASFLGGLGVDFVFRVGIGRNPLFRIIRDPHGTRERPSPAVHLI
jgi:hypothetical protein